MRAGALPPLIAMLVPQQPVEVPPAPAPAAGDGADASDAEASEALLRAGAQEAAQHGGRDATGVGGDAEHGRTTVALATVALSHICSTPATLAALCIAGGAAPLAHVALHGPPVRPAPPPGW